MEIMKKVFTGFRNIILTICPKKMSKHIEEFQPFQPVLSLFDRLLLEVQRGEYDTEVIRPDSPSRVGTIANSTSIFRMLRNGEVVFEVEVILHKGGSTIEVKRGPTFNTDWVKQQFTRAVIDRCMLEESRTLRKKQAEEYETDLQIAQETLDSIEDGKIRQLLK